MKTIITAIAAATPVAIAAALVLGLNDTTNAATATAALETSSLTVAPLILGAGLVGLLGLNHATNR